MESRPGAAWPMGARRGTGQRRKQKGQAFHTPSRRGTSRRLDGGGAAWMSGAWAARTIIGRRWRRGGRGGRSPDAVQLPVGGVFAGDPVIVPGARLSPLLERRVPVRPAGGAPRQHESSAHGEKQHGAQKETGESAWKPSFTISGLGHGRSPGAVVGVMPRVTPGAMPVPLWESMNCARKMRYARNAGPYSLCRWGPREKLDPEFPSPRARQGRAT